MWQLIESQVLGASAASVTLGSGGSLPQTYKSLKVAISTRSSAAGGPVALCYNFNGSTSGYTGRTLVGYAASSTGSGSITTLTVSGTVYGRLGDSGVNAGNSTTSTFSNGEWTIPNYAGSTNKAWSFDSVIESNDTTNNEVEMIAGLWSNTAAITSITLIPYLNSFAANSSFTLYGLK